MSDHGVILELAGLLKAGYSAKSARFELQESLAKMSPRRLAEFETLWSVAIASGGSVAKSMANLSDSFASDEAHLREIELAFAGPRATAKLVGWLPVFGLGIAQLFGLNPIGAIFTKPLAMFSVALGVALLISGRFWAKSILAKAQPVAGDPGLTFDAIRIGIDAGLPLSASVNQSIQAIEQFLGASPNEIDLSEVERLAVRNRDAGASLSALLISAAQVIRDTHRFENDKRIAKLSVKLMVPLGLLTLPAFVCLAIAPIGISLLSSGQNL